MRMIHDHVAQNIPSCRELVTSACFKQEWMWVKLRLRSVCEGGQCGHSSPKSPLAYSTVRSSQGRGRAQGRLRLLPLWSHGDVTARAEL